MKNLTGQVVNTPRGRGTVISSTENGWHEVKMPNNLIIKFRTNEISKVVSDVLNKAQKIEHKVHGHRSMTRDVFKRPHPRTHRRSNKRKF